MRIAYFTDTYRPQINGVTVSIDNFVIHLRKKGHTIYIFAPKIKNFQDHDPNIFRLSSVKVLSSEPEARMPLLFPNRNIQAMFKLKFDLIHAHGNGPFSLLGYEVARIRGIPFILTFHTLHTKYTHYFLNGKVIKPKMVAAGLKTFANLCDGVITPSNKMSKELISYGVKKPIKVIPNFIEYKAFQKKKTGFLRKKFNIPKNAPILLTVGRLGKEKNFEFLIKTFQKLVLINNFVHFVIVGRGPEETRLMQLTKKLNIQKRVHFADELYRDLMPQVYRDADIFVFASVTETQGIVILEAAASGLPLVVVKDAAFESIVKNNVNGYMLPLKQSEFVATLAKLIHDTTLKTELGKASRNILEEHFKPEVITEELVGFYQNTLNNFRKEKMLLRDIIQKAALIRPQKAAQVFAKFLEAIDEKGSFRSKT